MTKRVVLLVVILVLGALSLIGYFFLQQQPKAENPIYDLLPGSAAVVLKISHEHSFIESVQHTNMLWHEFSSTSTIRTLSKIGNLFDSLLVKNPALQQSLKGNYSYVTLHRGGPGRCDPVVFIPFSTLDEPAVLKVLSEGLNTSLESRTYEEHTIYTLLPEGKKLYVTTIGNCLALCGKSILLEDAIRQQLGNATLGRQKGFKDAYQTLGASSDVGIIFHYERTSSLLPSLLNKESLNKYATIGNMGRWTALDAKLSPSSIRLNGFTFAADTAGDYLSLYDEVAPSTLDVIQVLPYNTSGMAAFEIGNYVEFSGQYLSYLEQNKQAQFWTETQDAVQDSLGIDPQGMLSSWLGNEYAIGYVNSGVKDFNEELFGIFKIDNQEGLSNFLAKLGVQREGIEELSVKPLTFGKVFGAFVNPAFQDWDLVWYVQLEDYLVVCKNRTAMTTYLSNYTNGRLLISDPGFQNIFDNVASKSNILVYAKPGACAPYLKTLYNDSTLAGMERNAESIQKLEGVIIQYASREKGKLYNNVYINYNQEYQQLTNALWSVELPNPLVGAPQYVHNHATNSMDVIVQDVEGFIYLISSKGEIQWNKKLSGKIIGDVKQVDAYKNNKLQMLITTGNELYMVDRKGNDLEKFPIRFPDDGAPYLTAPVSVMDYENNRNYRLLICTREKQVLNYDITGARIDGWVFEFSQSKISKEFTHIVRNGKDYIFNIDNGGHVIALNRKGEERLNIVEPLVFDIDGGYEMMAGKDITNFIVVARDTSGTLIKQTLTGAIVPTDVKLEEAHKSIILDVTNDQLPDIIALSNGKFLVVDHVGEILVEREAPSDALFSVSTGTNETYYGYTDPIQQKVFVINSGGNLCEGFPVDGASQFEIADMNGDGILNLVVNNGKRVLTYTLSNTK